MTQRSITYFKDLFVPGYQLPASVMDDMMDSFLHVEDYAPGGAEINIKAAGYNAVGDGIADDVEAFLTANTDLVALGGGTIYVPMAEDGGTYRIADNIAFSNLVQLKFEKGAQIQPATSVVISNVSLARPPFAKIFGGAGSVTLRKGSVALPQWWGATGDGTTNDYAAWAAVNTAVQAIGGDILVPTGTYVIGTNLTFGTAVRLVMTKGAILSPSTGITLTFTEAPDLPFSQVFAGLGTIVFSKKVTTYPEWWGALGDGVADEYVQVQVAWNASGIMKIRQGRTFLVLTALTPPAASSTLLGEGDLSILKTTGANNAITASAKNKLWIDGVRFDGPTAPATFQRAVSVAVSTDIRVTNCFFNTWYAGVNLQACQRAKVQGNDFYDCAFGVEDIASFASNIIGNTAESGRLPARGDAHQGCTRCRSEGNVWFIGAGSGGSYTVGTHFFECNHCYASNTVMGADYGALMEADAEDCDGCSFVGFVAYNCGRSGSAGISCDTSNYFATVGKVRNFLISGCKVYGKGPSEANGIGLFHGCNNGTVTGCMVENAGYHGIQISACSKINVVGGSYKNNSNWVTNAFNAINIDSESGNHCHDIMVMGARAVEDRAGLFRQQYGIFLSDHAHTNIQIMFCPTEGENWQTGDLSFGASAQYNAMWINVDAAATRGMIMTGKLITHSGLGVNNSAAATTLGTVTKKMEVFNAVGVSLGFVPIYDAIT